MGDYAKDTQYSPFMYLCNNINILQRVSERETENNKTDVPLIVNNIDD